MAGRDPQSRGSSRRPASTGTPGRPRGLLCFQIFASKSRVLAAFVLPCKPSSGVRGLARAAFPARVGSAGPARPGRSQKRTGREWLQRRCTTRSLRNPPSPPHPMPARNKRPRLWEWTRPPTTPLARVVAPIPRAARNAPHENAPLLGDPLHPPLLQKEKEMFRKELRLWGEKPESLPVPLQSPVPLTEARKAAAVATESRPFPALGSARAGPIQDCWGRGAGWGSK